MSLAITKVLRTLKLRPGMQYLAILGIYHILNQHPQIYQNSKFHAKITLNLRLKRHYLGILGLQF